MNRPKWILLAVTLGLMAGAAGLLNQLRTHQRLGAPGVKTEPQPNTVRVRIPLPEQVPGYDSETVEVDDVTRKTLPPDTSFGIRLYKAKPEDGFWVRTTVVLMGADRTSLHRPQFCLTGQGWRIDSARSSVSAVRLDRPHPCDLPVVQLFADKDFVIDGQTRRARALYLYWYVADGAVTASASGAERMWSSAAQLLRTGVLQRWAYVSCLSICDPGQEDATLARMKQFIAAAVPDFQLAVPSASRAPTVANR
jgi:hypothetical protein